jgi:hypothetical protein
MVTIHLYDANLLSPSFVEEMVKAGKILEISVEDT